MSEVIEELGLDLDSSGSENQRMLGAVSGAPQFRPIIGQDGSFKSFVRCFNKGASLSSRSQQKNQDAPAVQHPEQEMRQIASQDLPIERMPPGLINSFRVKLSANLSHEQPLVEALEPEPTDPDNLIQEQAAADVAEEEKFEDFQAA